MKRSASDSEQEKMKKQSYPGEMNYKSYQKAFKQLIAEYKPLIDRFLPDAQLPSNQQQASLVNQCPSIAEHIRILLDGKVWLKQKAHHQILQELKEYTIHKTAKIISDFPGKELNYYIKVAAQSQGIIKQNKLKRRTKQLEWTGQRMLVLDIISVFFKFNDAYKKFYNIVKSIISRKILTQIFGVRDYDLQLLFMRFQYYLPVIKYEYFKDFEQLVVLFAIVQLKFRISNFQKKIGRIKVQNKHESDDSIEDKEDSEMDQKMYFRQREDYQYRFCEIAYIPLPQTKEHTIEALIPYNRAQVKQSIERIVEINNLYQQKREILKLKIKYRVSFLSLMMYLEDRREKFIGQQQFPAQSLPNLQICQWLFLKPISLIQALEIATQSRIFPTLPYKNNNPIMISYCTLAMKRLSLHTNVLKAYENIDRVLQRKSIYVCRFHYFLSQFQSQYISNESDQAFTVIVATNGSKILFAAAFKKQVGDYQYFGIIKSAFARIKHDKHNIVVYMNHQKTFEWIHLQKLFSIRRQGGDARIYFATHPQYFHIHMMANFLIRLLICYYKAINNSFISAAETSSSIVISSLHYMEEVREILYNLYPKNYHPIQDYSSLQIPFGEEQIRARITKAYQIFSKQSFPMWKSELIWLNAQSLQEGKIYYFNNRKLPKTRSNHSISQKTELLEYLQQKSNFFVDKYVQQMKWRHPYLSQEYKQEMCENLHYFLQKGRMVIKDLTQRLKDAVRFLVCYQAYFNEMLFNKQIEQFAEELVPEISFLTKIYEEQTYNLNNIDQDEIIEYCRQYFRVDLKTGERLKRYQRILKKAPFSKQQDHQDIKIQFIKIQEQ